jgi:replicative DNA helicase
MTPDPSSSTGTPRKRRRADADGPGGGGGGGRGNGSLGSGGSDSGSSRADGGFGSRFGGGFGGGGVGGVELTSLPHSIEAEMTVLGSMMIDNATIPVALEMLGTGEAFYGDTHLAIFRAIVDLHDRRIAVEPSTLTAELRERGLLERVGGLGFLARLETTVIAADNVAAHAEIILEHFQKRRLIEECHRLIGEATGTMTSAHELLNDAEGSISRIAMQRRRESTPPISVLARDTLDEIERRSKNRQAISGVATGYSDLDHKTGGFQKTDLLILAARPAMGKTAFALNICQFVAMQSRGAVAIFSLEMSAPQLTQRLIASLAHVNLQKIRTGRIDPDTMTKLGHHAMELAGARILIDDTPGLSLLELRSKARRFAVEQPDLSLVMIDYLQLMTGGRRFESRQQEVSEISRSLKELARELKVPVLALSQLSRATEQRSGKDKRPILSDLRESGSIEQDADVVMFVHREEYYRRKEEEAKAGTASPQEMARQQQNDRQKNAAEIAEIIIGKQRNGPTGTVELLFKPDTATFVNYTKKQ